MRTTLRRARGAGLVLALSLPLAACAQGEAATGGGGEGVAAGATKAEWKEAFADVDPITVRTQSSAAQGSPVGKMYEDYFAEVEEWSDGKITFDVAFSNAVADTLEVDDALSDGRLDMGNVLFVYEADKYPVNAALADASFIGEQAPAVNPLMLHGAMNQVALESDAYAQELEDNNMVPILPWFSGDANGIQCNEPRSSRADFKGVATVAAGRVNALELEAIGATPTSLPYTELFEALQRNTVECSLNSMRVANLMGLFDVSKHFTIDEQVGLSKTPGGWLVSKDFWDGLPLVAQQLLFDKSRVILGENITGSTQYQADGLRAILEAEGSITSFSEDARKAIQGAHEKALEVMDADDRLPSGMVDEMTTQADDWAGTVADLGFDPSIGFAEWPDAHAKGYDLGAYLDKVYEVFAEHRPN